MPLLAGCDRWRPAVPVLALRPAILGRASSTLAITIPGFNSRPVLAGTCSIETGR
jgi:hypothetical protein